MSATAKIIPIPIQNEVIKEAQKEIKKVFKPKPRPGTAGYKWSPQQRARFLATMKAKAKERRKSRKRPREERLEDATDAYIGRITTTKAKRSIRAERSDAVVYLRAATRHVAHVTNAELLSLLALRRLLGEIE